MGNVILAGHVHAVLVVFFGPLEEYEALQRPFVEGDETQPESGRIGPWAGGQVGAPGVRFASYCREQIAGQGHVSHLFGGDLHDGPAPPVHDRQLLFGDSLGYISLHAECREQVATHDAVFQFGGFGEEIDQLRPVLDPYGGVHHCVDS